MSNTRFWDALYTTPVNATKPYKVSGAELTEIKPSYITRRLTEMFGPCGLGWGINIIKSAYVTVPVVADAKDGYHTCQIELWYIDPETKERGSVLGQGHTAVYGKYGIASDIEKASETDALSRAARRLGIGGDVVSEEGWNREEAREEEILAQHREALESAATKQEFEVIISKLPDKVKIKLKDFVGELRSTKGWPKQ